MGVLVEGVQGTGIPKPETLHPEAEPVAFRPRSAAESRGPAPAG